MTHETKHFIYFYLGERLWVAVHVRISMLHAVHASVAFPSLCFSVVRKNSPTPVTAHFVNPGQVAILLFKSG